MARYYEYETGAGPLHVNIVYDEDGPYRLFASLSPIGTELSATTNALAIAISKFLEVGGDPATIIKHLESIKADRPFGFGEKRIESIAQAIARALKDHLRKENGHSLHANL